MSDFFSSALSYFSGGGSEGGAGNRFVGQVVDLGGGNKLKVKKVIAEGKWMCCEAETSLNSHW